MTVQLVLFYLFAAILLFSSVKVISARNPVHAVLFLILAFFNAAALLIMQGAEFLGMLLVIVYVGAVAILFLFVVMMLDINFAKARKNFKSSLPIGLLVALVLFTEIYFALQYSLSNYQQAAIDALNFTDTTNAHAIGMVLYTNFAYPFEMAGLILLVAMIGAIVLTNRNRENVRKQNIAKQIARRPQDCVTLVNLNKVKENADN